jgi:4-hydroxybenzoate polyprenyltransferase
MLPGWQGIALAAAARGRLPDPRLLALFFLGAGLMRAAGCAYNDIVDADFDAKVARTAGRPIPSGQVSVKGAWTFLVACSLLSLLILLSLNVPGILLGVASLALVAAYPFMKRITWWPQAWLGLTFNWGALLGFAAAWPWTGWRGATSALPGLLLYASGVFWTLGYDTIYAVQDLEDDALAGVKSSARRLGSAAPTAVLAFYLAALALSLAAGASAHLGPLFWPVALAYGAVLLVQPPGLRLDQPAGALALFKSNVPAAALLFAAIVAGLWKGR